MWQTLPANKELEMRPTSKCGQYSHKVSYCFNQNNTNNKFNNRNDRDSDNNVINNININNDDDDDDDDDNIAKICQFDLTNILQECAVHRVHILGLLAHSVGYTCKGSCRLKMAKGCGNSDIAHQGAAPVDGRTGTDLN